jgi:hypothetical protein
LAAVALGNVDALAALIAFGLCPYMDVEEETVRRYLSRASWPGNPPVSRVVALLRGVPLCPDVWLGDAGRVIFEGPHRANTFDVLNENMASRSAGTKVAAWMIWTSAPFFWPVQDPFRPLRMRYGDDRTHFVTEDALLVIGENGDVDFSMADSEMPAY